MENVVNENIFLLEFLVDNIQLSEGKNGCPEIGDICVAVQFLDNDPLDICEDDFTPKRKYQVDSDKLKSGKSCLFSLTSAKANAALSRFDINVSIYKKIQCASGSDKIEIGTSLIPIANLFSDLISTVTSTPNCPQSLAAKTQKENYPIKSTSGDNLGEIGMYIRLSCFGKLIVTQFQMNLDDKSVLFKDKEGNSLYRYKKVSGKGKSNGMGRAGSVARAGLCVTTCPSEPCAPKNPRPSVTINPTPTYAPCNECSPPINQQSTGTNSCNQCSVATPGTEVTMQPCNECGAKALTPYDSYQEIGASMGGNALTIRVHKDRTIVNTQDEVKSRCKCSSGSSRKTSLIMGPGCGPNIPEKPFSFTMAGSGGGCTPNTNNVTVVPPVCTDPDGTQHTELSDPERDIFLLKINKKSEGVDRKTNLELELCTPKPCNEKEGVSKETQYEDDGTGGDGGKKKKKEKPKKKKSKGKKRSKPKPSKEKKDDGNDGKGKGKGKDDNDGGFGNGYFIGEPKPKKCPSDDSMDYTSCFWPPPVCGRQAPQYSSYDDDDDSYPCSGSRPCKPYKPCCRMWS